MNATDASDAAAGAADRKPDWLVLSDETLLWVGGPRIQTVLPSVAVGLVLIAAGAVVLAGVLPIAAANSTVAVALALLAVLAGLLVSLWSYLAVTNTDYAVTDRTLYHKRGVLSLTVTAVGYETVQNVSYSQGVRGTLFGYGTLAFDTAGSAGTELAFTAVNDPGGVRATVSEQLSRVGRHAAGGSDGRLPGTREEWNAVLTEVAAIRRLLDDRR